MVRKMWPRGRGLVAAFIACLAIGAGTARAGEVTAQARREARRHYEKGLTLYTASDFTAAREEFRSARALIDAPELIFNLAQCARNLGDHEEALALYQEFLARVPGAPNRARVEEYVAAERALLKPVAPPVEKPVVQEPPKVVTGPAPAPPAPPPQRPVWKRPWFWIVVGGAALAAAGLAVGLALGLSSPVGTELGVRDLGPLVRF
jgi:tetratricopeptide (TPR) repeat protein